MCEKKATTATGKDILSLMIAENRKAEGKLAEMELVDQVMTFLLAGHETTSTAVNSCLTIILIKVGVVFARVGSTS